MTATREMHLAFLADVESQIAAKREEIEELERVARYHQSRVCNMVNGDASDHEDEDGTDSGDGIYSGMMRHDAAEAVLKANGHPMKTGDIVSALQGEGYGADLRRRFLYNAVYTAMNRRTDVFVQADSGKWALVEWGGKYKM